jgi:hypothetical protein
VFLAGDNHKSSDEREQKEVGTIWRVLLLLLALGKDIYWKCIFAIGGIERKLN